MKKLKCQTQKEQSSTCKHDDTGTTGGRGKIKFSSTAGSTCLIFYFFMNILPDHVFFLFCSSFSSQDCLLAFSIYKHKCFNIISCKLKRHRTICTAKIQWLLRQQKIATPKDAEVNLLVTVGGRSDTFRNSILTSLKILTRLTSQTGPRISQRKKNFSPSGSILLCFTEPFFLFRMQRKDFEKNHDSPKALS